MRAGSRLQKDGVFRRTGISPVPQSLRAPAFLKSWRLSYQRTLRARALPRPHLSGRGRLVVRRCWVAHGRAAAMLQAVL
jgi:hypothetical protein